MEEDVSGTAEESSEDLLTSERYAIFAEESSQKKKEESNSLVENEVQTATAFEDGNSNPVSTEETGESNQFIPSLTALSELDPVPLLSNQETANKTEVQSAESKSNQTFVSASLNQTSQGQIVMSTVPYKSSELEFEEKMASAIRDAAFFNAKILVDRNSKSPYYWDPHTKTYQVMLSYILKTQFPDAPPPRGYKPLERRETHPTLEGYITSLIEQKKRQRRHWNQLRELLEQQQRDQMNQHYLISHFQQLNQQITALTEKCNRLQQSIQVRRQQKAIFYKENTNVPSFLHLASEDTKEDSTEIFHLQLQLNETNEKLQKLYQTQREIQKQLNKISNNQTKLQSDLKRVYNVLYPGAVFKDNTIFVNLSSYAQGTIEKLPQQQSSTTAAKAILSAATKMSSAVSSALPLSSSSSPVATSQTVGSTKRESVKRHREKLKKFDAYDEEEATKRMKKARKENTKQNREMTEDKSDSVSETCHECEQTTEEEVIQCSQCKARYHPSCLGLPLATINKIKSYPWKCTNCKVCEVCQETGDEEKLLLCDRCDRGRHTYCLCPPLLNPPEGDWMCEKCEQEIKMSESTFKNQNWSQNPQTEDQKLIQPSLLQPQSQPPPPPLPLQQGIEAIQNTPVNWNDAEEKTTNTVPLRKRLSVKLPSKLSNSN
jgi:hypothetical protein